MSGHYLTHTWVKFLNTQKSVEKFLKSITIISTRIRRYIWPYSISGQSPYILFYH